MNLEQLEKGNNLAFEIRQLQKQKAILENDKLAIRIDRSVHYNLDEESIDLLPEEEEALKSVREAYRTILLTANNRKLKQARSEFEKL